MEQQVKLGAAKNEIDEQRLKHSFLQRIFEILFSISMLVIFAPAMFIFAILIKLSSSGPALYRGKRIGKDGKIFTIYKFRTLNNGSENKIGATLLQSDAHCNSLIGLFLRKSKFDELPQFVNVLKGDMNIIGPRPERPIRAQIFFKTIPGYSGRFKVRPGITGLAQVKGHYYTHAKNKLRYEVLYMKNRSLTLDLKILGDTLLQIIKTILRMIEGLLKNLFKALLFRPVRVEKEFQID